MTSLEWAKNLHSLVWKDNDPCVATTHGVTHLRQEASSGEDLIIIRDEYKRIWTHIAQASRELTNSKPGLSRGLVVWGHPGIGKSLFLLFALVQSLRAKRTVALCRSAFNFLYFDENGVSLVPWAQAELLDLPPGVIALYDTVPGQDSPHGIFTNRMYRAYVVHATSPKISRWKEWSKQLNAMLWPMPLWSTAELEKIDQLFPRDTRKYYSVVQLSAILGPSPCKCSEKIKLGHNFADYTPLDFEDSTALYRALTNGDVSQLTQGTHFQTYFFAGTIRDCGVRDYMSDPANYCRYYIPTRFLREAALRTFRKMSLEEQQTICSQFSAHPKLCGAFYEVLGLKVLVSDGLLCRFPKDKREHVLPAGLRILASDNDDVVDVSNFGSDCLWVPPSDFPSLDAVAVLNGGRHDIKPEGVARAIVKFSAVANVRYEFVFITPSEEIGKKMALTKGPLNPRKPHASRQHAPPEHITIPVGYAVAGFLKPDDLQALAADHNQMVLSDDPTEAMFIRNDVEMDTT
ncbi:hypothetical protein GGX14DRAFT_603167 [Mycena pura]|uniref:Uncharacterized protein n=1 Tax=Mycena pura TaxID=153505 RepID=A0AAD6UNC1_9AGAR|nr:hypothetical protein GGX14DRAFT_603167 [Mycena pura]